MSVSIKTPEQIEHMRVAGRLAAEVLEMIVPHVKAGVTTEELDQLWREERPRVTLAVQAAAAQGDRSENAEYTYGKKRLHEIDRRVRFLRKRLEGMTVVDPVRDWKAVLSLEAALPELYNLGASDPDAANLADAHPRVTLDLLRALARSPVFPRSADDFDVRDTRAQKAAGAGRPDDEN